jgi:hypothetical protein
MAPIPTITAHRCLTVHARAARVGATTMSDPIHQNMNESFVSRVFQHEATKKGLAGAIAGLLIAAVIEGVWPSST